jgi:hypothetical protein
MKSAVLIILGMFLDVLLYEKDSQGIALKTKTHVFKVQASDQLYEEIVKKVVPEFVVKTS